MFKNLMKKRKNRFIAILLGFIYFGSCAQQSKFESIKFEKTKGPNDCQYKIVKDLLDNKNCNPEKGVMWRNLEDQCNISDRTYTGDNTITKNICLVGSGGCSKNATIDYYQRNGLSGHYLVDENAGLTQTVDEAKFNLANFAGKSKFFDYNGLNFHSIGVVIVNPIVSLSYKEFNNFKAPIRRKDSSMWWYSFGEQQFKASCWLTKNLQNTYKIPGWNVITHSDCAPDRKFGLGPMWHYQKAFEEYEVGFFPSETHQIDFTTFQNLSYEDYFNFIYCLGYHKDYGYQNVLRAYQMHFSPENISGELVDKTKIDILKHIIALWNFQDLITGEKHNYFLNKFNIWAENNPRKLSSFNEFFDC